MTYDEHKASIIAKRIVFDPCAPRGTSETECEGWETPETWTECRDTMARLPRQSRVLCAITAAEMVLPYWLEYEAQQAEDWEHRGAPQRAIKAAYKGKSANASYAASSAASSAASYAASSAAGVGGVAYAASAYASAYAYAASASALRERFYKAWWSRCRARLAFAEPDKAEITWSVNDELRQTATVA